MSNADLIERLRTSDGDWGATMDEAADALAAADKRIAELNHNLDFAADCHIKTGQERDAAYKRIAELERNYLDSVEVNTALQHGLYEAERKLAVAREALKQIPHALGHDFYAAATTIADEALAQIGGEEDTSAHDEAEYYAELNRGYAKDRM